MKVSNVMNDTKQMASGPAEMQDRCKLYYKFTKVLTVKVAQIVVQSRQGKKITHQSSEKLPEHGADAAPQWFNLSIPDEPGVSAAAARVLRGSVREALARALVVHIALRTADAALPLELWSVRLAPPAQPCSPSALYGRMTTALKSTLAISRVTPAYKLARAQHNDTYTIEHAIRGGLPDYDALGAERKTIKVSELHTPVGTLLVEVAYRTQLTLAAPPGLLLQSQHFAGSPPRPRERRELDLTRPLTAGAFVDAAHIAELHKALGARLPPEPSQPPHSLDAIQHKTRTLTLSDEQNANAASTSSAPPAPGPTAPGPAPPASRAVDVPRARPADKYAGLMEFPFAEGSPIAELASFYQECCAARGGLGGEWAPAEPEPALEHQLQAFEAQVAEFDDMVTAMCADHH